MRVKLLYMEVHAEEEDTRNVKTSTIHPQHKVSPEYTARFETLAMRKLEADKKLEKPAAFWGGL